MLCFSEGSMIWEAFQNLLYHAKVILSKVKLSVEEITPAEKIRLPVEAIETRTTKHTEGKEDKSKKSLLEDFKQICLQCKPRF